LIADEDLGERDEHPLAGVLDRLLARERGALRPSAAAVRHEESHPQATVSAAAPVDPARRRTAVVAGLGEDGGLAAVKAMAAWAARGGRRPAVLDLGSGEPTAQGASPWPGHASTAGRRIPLARIPRELERLRHEPAEVLSAIVERLHRHESDADLLIVRIPAAQRMVLMRAAFLAGGIVIPVDRAEGAPGKAFRLSREVSESFPDLPIWPAPLDRTALDRYLRMMRDFLRMAPQALDMESAEIEPFLQRLAAPPEEGFVAALLTPDTAPPPPEILEMGWLDA